METFQSYKSFNSNKSIEELKYNMRHFEIELKDVKFELQFYNFIIEADVFKPHVFNLFEKLEKYKNQINSIEEHRAHLLEDINTHINLITNKIECDDMACDNFFIKKYEGIESKIFDFKKILNALKLNLFQFLESVIIIA